MNVELVVARYKEDLSWINHTDRDLVTVYNKNDLLHDPAIETIRDLDGVIICGLNGGYPKNEAHTYLYHILQNYNTLANTTFFVQGNPFDHTPDILTDLKKNILGFDWLVNNNVWCDGNGCPHHCNLPVGRIWQGVFNEPFPSQGIHFVPGAQFAVTREQIYKYPRAYYLEIARKMELEYAQWYCWFLERAWKRIFTGES